jgi:hypothetical protein
MNDKPITATYEKDTFRFHRFLIDEGQAVKGTLYIPKDTEAEDMPKEILIKLKANDQGEKC